LDRSPPPFFKQGHSAHARLVFFALLAIILIIVDSRFKTLNTIRYAAGTALYPLQWALAQPSQAVDHVAHYFQDTQQLLKENTELRTSNLQLARKQDQANQIAAENTRLRGLLDLKVQTIANSVIASVQYETRDPYTKRFILNKGGQHGVVAGQPVLDANGVAGLITRVFPASSEVALITDREITLPVQLQRTSQRSIAYGDSAQNALEIRYLPGNTDIKEGDLFVTSGLDTLYPAGLMVGTVSRIERGSASAFTRAWLAPSAGLTNATMLLILLTQPTNLPDLPSASIETKKKGRKP
jgi:rod shape-determining protein MreC